MLDMIVRRQRVHQVGASRRIGVNENVVMSGLRLVDTGRRDNHRLAAQLGPNLLLDTGKIGVQIEKQPAQRAGGKVHGNDSQD